MMPDEIDPTINPLTGEPYPPVSPMIPAPEAPHGSWPPPMHDEDGEVIDYDAVPDA